MPTNYRLQDKNALQSILQALVFEGDPLLVNSYYTTTASRYPYIFITDGPVTPNTSGGSQYEIGTAGTYRRGYTYQVNAVFQVGEADGATEARMGVLESILLDCFQGKIARDNVNWLDLVLRDVTGPYGTDVSLSDDCVLETFTIQIDHMIAYPD